MRGGGAGEVRWNKDTQSWERVGARGHSAPPPPPDRPPTAGGPGEWPAGEPVGGASAPAPGSDWPQAPVAPPGAPRGRRNRVIAGAVGAAVAVTSLATWLAVDQAGDDDKAGGASSSTATSDGQAESPSDTWSDPAPTSEDPFTAASESPEVPDGFRAVEDPSGFSAVVPEDWTRSEQKGGAVVFYTSPDELGLLQIFEVVEPGYTPDDALDVAVDSLSGQPGFTQISRGAVPDETYASELVYEYDSEELGERVKAVDRVFQTDDGRLYAMVVRGTTQDWSATQETLEKVRAAFTPS
ncbi:hypothetical protein AB5J55_26115 [Streptomyces sp. R11]|uniref:Serine/arginine repetitive matrix protein 2 n=1 Tax=Streptomyces sp. R11 TaxID=3238625 RepID=A0AB39N3F4_9ACTN